eukprot:CAMPEP_0201576916 /NCGR_PEP_ID=MMETSP0190_2-20130828/23009_1 /ASSEMBLY_ACC=CAM_ASM_000263 /TAXON_ID=37353 /ORGANISM="Rosalina sp." /LENGTH=528 /DNA_ID=CAMNT_0048008351 /DNA_START=313 /DNA_END=1896 /DNA_ORIENTATION=+
MTRDLVWDRSPVCGDCPRCPCDNGAREIDYIRNYTQFDTSSEFQVSQCYECSCDYFYQYINDNDIPITVYGRQCSLDATFNTPDLLDTVSCPVVTAKPTPQPTDGPSCDDGDNNEYLPGEFFFYNDNTTCTTYCMCNSTGGMECQKGWNNIVTNGGEEMKDSFLSLCSFRLQDAWDDTTRWYKEDDACVNSFTRGSGNCPYALCPSTRDPDNEDDDDYHAVEYAGVVWVDEDEKTEVDYTLYNCATCNCYYDGTPSPLNLFNPSNETLVICDAVTGQSNVQDSAECTSDFLNCTIDYDNQVDGPISAYDNYCGWSKIEVPYDFDPDVVCIEDDIEQSATWGDKPKLICDAVYGYEEMASSSGQCSITDVSVTVKTYDCVDRKWQSETQKVTIYDMCCGSSPEGTAPCNNQAISPTALGTGDNECTSNSNVETLYKTLLSCNYGDRGVSEDYIKEMECGTALSETSNYKSRVCDIIEDKWKWDSSCICKYFQALSKMQGDSEYEDSVRNTLQSQFDLIYASTKANLELW